MSNVLIVNMPKGGHACIGHNLKGLLEQKGHVVFLDEQTAPSDMASKYSSQDVDIVIENKAKDWAEIDDIVQFAKDKQVSQFLYVSSAGIYSPSEQLPYVESDKVKNSKAQGLVEKNLSESGLTFSCFRPMYIAGPTSSKRDYTDFFFDRMSRNQPIPIPGSGEQLTSVTDARDVSAMVAAAVGASGAANQIFNCVSPRFISFNGMAKACARAMGVDPATLSLVHYDPKKLPADVDSKKAFPFRNAHFIASPAKATSLLGWTCERDLDTILRESYESFQTRGEGSKEKSFSSDQVLLAAA
eukprot:CAMPEP_0184683932 /NCGR_PEP_ID=MMETSP0312-20130426/13234_1 /TAXON_ID=31354 /ORGANISM="Compsopogon coeruleus, Strain SAG 36.94" /LENGTH=299 /DNA_ID=CAMNT_0027136665 /DNA_START=253 /DNA_END=1152 /DNA_ORIENTATION=+